MQFKKCLSISSTFSHSISCRRSKHNNPTLPNARYTMANKVHFSAEVEESLRRGRPVVALESTIIAHGLPYPSNLECARALEATVREYAIPATIAVISGRYHAGLTESQLEDLARNPNRYAKLALRDLPFAVARKTSGATTVSATVHIAELAGIAVHATGGIGGIHRGRHLDVSQDLWALATKRVLVVSAGVKSVLHIPHTLEALEALSVPVLVWRSDRFPAFYSPESGCSAPVVVQNEREIADIYRAREKGGVLLAVPVPPTGVARGSIVQQAIERALNECENNGIVGKQVTPFLLKRVAELSGGESVRANVELAKNNAHIAARVAAELVKVKSILKKRVSFSPDISPNMNTTDESRPESNDVVVAGVAAVDIIATPFETVTMVAGSSNRGRVNRELGGVACNIARAAALNGDTKVTLVAVVGTDEHADIVRKRLRQSNINETGLVSLSSTRTPTYCAIHDRKGELLYAIADMELKAQTAARMVMARVRARLAGAKVLALDANFPSQLLCSLAEMAKQAGLLVWYEPTSVAKCSRIVKAMDCVTIMSPNSAELRKLAENVVDEAQCVHQLQRRGVRTLVVTRGAHGAALYNGDLPVVEVEAQKVRVRNTSGAGDSLAGAMIAHIARHGTEHKVLCDALHLGVCAAAHTCGSEYNSGGKIRSKL